jgi:hypothetical protein
MHHFSSFFPASPFLLNGSSRPLLDKRCVPRRTRSQPTHTPHPGNQGLRYFPYTGYLGLTPIRVEGSAYLAT